MRNFRPAVLSLWAWLPQIRLSESAARTMLQSGCFCLWRLNGRLQSQALIALESLVFMRNAHNIINTDLTRNVPGRNRHDFFFWLACSKKKKIQARENVSNNRLLYRQEENTYCGKTEQINARLETFSRKCFVRLAQQRACVWIIKMNVKSIAVFTCCGSRTHDTDPKASQSRSEYCEVMPICDVWQGSGPTVVFLRD